MDVSIQDIEGFLQNIRQYKTIREGLSAFHSENVKDPSIDRRSFSRGFELGMYYAVDVLCGTEWTENHLDTEE